jgi:hypothetical protein
MPAGHTRWAIVNRTGNQVVRLLLRSPLHPLVSWRVALITVRGRRSGREFTIPVGYERQGDLVTVTVSWPEQKRWWRNLRGEGAPVSLRLRGEERTGHAVAVGDDLVGVAVEVRLDPRRRRDR